MPDYVAQWLPVGWVGGAVLFLLAAAWLWRNLVGPMVHWVLATAKRISQLLDDWQGVPARPGVPAQPGVMEQLYDFKAALRDGEKITAEHTEAILDIRKQVQPNGGTSAHDAHTKQLLRIEQAQRVVAGTVDGLREEVQQLRVEKTNDHEDIRHRIRHLEEHEES